MFSLPREGMKVDFGGCAAGLVGSVASDVAHLVVAGFIFARAGEVIAAGRRLFIAAAAGERGECTRRGGEQEDESAAGEADEETRFSIYQRENLNDAGDFSCGIAYLPPGGPPLTLARYNGPSHEHGAISYHAHIHRATERAMATGRKPESVAEATDRFETLDGAMACLVEDFNLTGIRAQPDRPRLFP